MPSNVNVPSTVNVGKTSNPKNFWKRFFLSSILFEYGQQHLWVDWWLLLSVSCFSNFNALHTVLMNVNVRNTSIAKNVVNNNFFCFSYYLIRFSTICGLVDGWCCLYVVIEHWFEMVLAGLGLQCRAWCPRDHDVCINVSCLFYRMKHWLCPNTGTPIKLPLFHVWKKCLLILSEKWKQLNPPEPLAPFPAGICDRASLMDFGF